MDNHGLASTMVWQKSEVWSLMQSAAGLDQRGWVELMLALRRGIAGMLGEGGGGEGEGGGGEGEGGGDGCTKIEMLE